MLVHSMNLIVRNKLIVIFFLVFHVKAQDDSSTHITKPFHPGLAVVIGALSIISSITFLLLAYAKLCHITNPADGSGEEQIPSGVLRSVSRFSGLERTVVESLPFFRFSSLKGSREGLECAVCLSKFEEQEVLRLLPRCRHAFHIACIDKWLESHSSCPLCRYKFNPDDLTSFPLTNSLRYPRNSTSNLSEESNLELFVQREQEKSSRFNMIKNLQRLAMRRKEEHLLQTGENDNHDRDSLHKFKHKIIVSDLICRSRWSDVNSSDIMLLNSEMLNVMSSKRFSHDEFKMNEEIAKIKEDIGRKRQYESKVGKFSNNLASTSSTPIASNHDHLTNTTSKTLDPAEKRSMSEIVHLPRYADLSSGNHISGLYRTSRKDERVRRLWLPIARRTVQWLAGREGVLKYKASQPNV